MLKHPAVTMGKSQFNILSSSARSSNQVYKKGFQNLKEYARLDYKPNALTIVDIGPYGVGKGHKEFTGDAMQIYALVLLYSATNDKRYAQHAMVIQDAWYFTTYSFTGSNAPLEIAWGATCIVRAFEILKYTYSGWCLQFEKRLNNMIDKLFLPNLRNRYNEIRKWNNNWILTIIEALMQIALFRNDRQEYTRLIIEYKNILPSCVPNDSGKSTETTRDLIHAQFQIGSIVQIAEMGWQQDIDIYSYFNDCVKRTMEYHADILLGNVPPDVKREQLKDIWFMPCSWEIGLNHYLKRRKVQMPRTSELLSKKRPEKASFNWGPPWMFYDSA
jgi:hypothetical protein